MARYVALLMALIVPAAAAAFDVQATIKRVDADNARIAFGGPDGRDRTANVAPDAKLFDDDGKDLAGGLKSEQLKEGAKALLTVVPDGNRPVITALRLGGGGSGAGQAKA